MKYLVMCEGPNEKVLLDLLLDKNKLIFSRNDLIDLEIFHARQLVPYITSKILTYNKNDIKIIRVGDKQNDSLKIPENVTRLIKKENIIKCRTRPELEILLIINEGLFKKYNKVKGKIKVKIFAKENIKYKGSFYNGSCDFWLDYYNKRINILVDNIKTLKELTRNNKDEIYLADLLK